jgi:cellulose synthase/poly-beta-1,6-N-acetylglucosamine synthase-like glycosyltransferase
LATVSAAILTVLTLPLAVLSGYLLVVSLASCLARPRVVPGARLSVAVVIPAHNEAASIESTLQGVFRSDYPADLYSVWVIADNCDDDTAERARRAGARVVERRDTANRGKGQALDWFLKTHEPELRKSDVLAFIDADTTVHPEFLKAMSETLAIPEIRGVQGCYKVDNIDAGWRAAITAVGFGGVNLVRPMGQTVLGGSVQLKGNGMAFASGIVLDRGWSAHSIVEDMEYGLQLLLDGITVSFNPHAIVESSMPTGHSDTASQRRRWEGGRFAVAAAYAPKLLWRFLSTGKYVYLDALLEAMIPPLSLMALWTFGLLAATASLGHWMLFGVVLCCALAQGVYLVFALVHIRAPWRVWLMLPAIPLFVACKIPVYISLILRRQTSWNRTPRA